MRSVLQEFSAERFALAIEPVRAVRGSKAISAVVL